MKKFLIIVVSIILPLLVILYYYKFYNSDLGRGTQCSFHQITQLQCPGCGGQRAFYYLLHGEILTSLRYNLLIVIAIPVLLFLYYMIVQCYGLKNSKYVNHPFFGIKFVVILFIVLFVFFVIRNIPIYLSPV